MKKKNHPYSNNPTPIPISAFLETPIYHKSTPFNIKTLKTNMDSTSDKETRDISYIKIMVPSPLSRPFKFHLRVQMELFVKILKI